MMIALYIIISLILVILGILFLNISFIFELKDDFDFKVKILFITLNAEKIAGLIGDDKQEKSIEEKSKKIKKKRKKSISELIDTITDIVDLIKQIFKEFTRYAKFKICYLDFKVATDDAARTALIYGAVSGGVYSAIEVLDGYFNIKKNYKKIAVYPDFSATETKANLKIIISIKPIHILLGAMHMLPGIAERQKGK